MAFGNSGSGKSTFAKQRACVLGCVHLDLDTVAWVVDARQPTRRPLGESLEEIELFLAQHESWVVEGCYASLLEPFRVRATEVVFLNPGVAICQENCRRRPWEPHKYASPKEQDAKLEFLLDWVAQYEERDDEFSLKAHRALFDAHQGPKRELTSNER